METLTKEYTPALYHYLREATASYLLVNGWIKDNHFTSVGAAMQMELNRNLIYNN